MIVKCQRQSFPDPDSTDIFIYNKDESVCTIQPMSTNDIEALFQDDRKVYANAHLEGTIIVIDEVVDDQDW
jgi:hypothetical protein